MKLMESLNNLELDNKKIALIVLVSLVILYLDYTFVISLQLKNMGNLKPKIEKLERDLNTFNKDWSNINNLKTKQVKSDIKAKVIITEEELPALLEQISNFANKNNMRIMQIKPSKDIKSKEDKAVLAAKLTPLFITLDVTGTYHNVGAFVNDLENADQLLIIQELKIRREQTDNLKENASLLVKTYVKK